MRYMLMMYGRETTDDGAVDIGDPETDAATSQADEDEPCWMPWAREMKQRGIVLLDGAQLQDSSTATTVRSRGDEILVADGPFAETKEQIAGYDVIECTDLDEAIYAAARHPVALGGGLVEVRPIMMA